ncbi:MAG: hypothetical protein P1R58_03345 [bacterium]|nr:hypothetical protein [bacterium]
MKMERASASFTTLLFGVLLLLGTASDSLAMEKCLLCHRKHDLFKTESTGRKVSLFVDEEILGRSAHASRVCTDCHVDIVALPHSKDVKKVNCRRCHYVGNPVGAPEGDLYDQYEHSVHGLEVAKGNSEAPICQDCHGDHNVMPLDSADSKVAKQNVPQTCGKCHMEIYAAYAASTHGHAVSQGNLDAPVCSDCHGEHNIVRHEDPSSSVYGLNLTATCSDCHGPLGVASKYGIKADRAATFEDSFHGVAQEMGSRVVANCASCHGFHDILPEADPKSRINPDNIPKTCGQVGCHPEATATFTSGQIHVDPHSEESGILYYISKGFLILTASVLAGLMLFILLDLTKRARMARRKR